MKAMILAAGFGTRLRPLTDGRPKALVTVAGKTLLEITIERLRNFGVTEIIVNVHHFAEQIEEFLREHRNFGLRIEISREDELLDTGGGLKKAAWFFRGDEAPFLLHNVDVLSAIDLGAMLKAHRDRRALATLAVMQRKTSRYLLFDDVGQLCGRRAGVDGEPEMARPAETTQARAFCGIHVIEPRLLSMLTEQGAFSIIPAYLRLAADGERIAAFQADAYSWRDVGKLEDLAEAEKELLRSGARSVQPHPNDKEGR
jgi:NDP-sugar pyrophosphorylase family protein